MAQRDRVPAPSNPSRHPQARQCRGVLVMPVPSSAPRRGRLLLKANVRAAATRRGCSTGPRSGQRPHVGGQPTVAEQQPAAISWPELSRHATWDEVDGDTWTIPGERTKTGKPHRIPLSGRAQAVLDEARRLADDTGLIFGAPAPASRSATTPSARHYVPLTSRNRLRVPCQPQRLARSRRRVLRTGRSRVGAPAKRDRQVVPARRPTRSAPPDHGTLGTPRRRARAAAPCVSQLSLRDHAITRSFTLPCRCLSVRSIGSYGCADMR